MPALIEQLRSVRLGIDNLGPAADCDLRQVKSYIAFSEPTGNNIELV